MGFLQMLGLAVLPGLGILIGTLISEKKNLSDRVSAAALHWIAGTMLAVVGVEILPEVLKAQPSWPILIAVLIGGFLAIGSDRLIDRFTSENGKWTILFAVAVDMFADGITIGVSANISPNFALLVVLGLFIGDTPEGLINTSSFKKQDTSRKFRVLVAVLLGFLCLAGAVTSYWLTRNQSDLVKYLFLALTTGMYIQAAVEDLIERSHAKTGKNTLNQSLLIVGFTVYMAGSLFLKQ